MSNENVDLIRRAYQAYATGDLQAMLEFVDPDLEWAYLDPSLEDPQPQVCHGRTSWSPHCSARSSGACGHSWKRPWGAATG